jgi:flavin reductase (DIM6/NTAB) family NADH-FMN oxidoreductase RutF
MAMFYRPEDGHGLPHNPFKAIISPRPIGWISSLDTAGRANLAPYSFFNGVSDTPPMVMFSATATKEGNDEIKDSVANIRQTGEFVVNVVSAAMQDAMNTSSGIYPHGEDEFVLAGLEKAPGETVTVPRVAGAPAALECKLEREVVLPGGNIVVIGLVSGIFIDEAHLKDGIFDVTSFRPLARLGYMDYTAVEQVFALKRPYQ